MKSRKAELMNELIIHIILIVLILGLFLVASAEKINGRGVKQQILEKQTSLLISSAVPGMSFEISKFNINGKVNSVEIEGGLVKIGVEGLESQKGYPYFSPYKIQVMEETTAFVVKVK